MVPESALRHWQRRVAVALALLLLAASFLGSAAFFNTEWGNWGRGALVGVGVQAFLTLYQWTAYRVNLTYVCMVAFDALTTFCSYGVLMQAWLAGYIGRVAEVPEQIAGYLAIALLVALALVAAALPERVLVVRDPPPPPPADEEVRGE